MKYNKPAQILFFELAILLLPYDAMNVMPSTYAPISAYAFLISLVLSFGKGKFRSNKLNNKAIVMFFYMAIVSIVTATIYVENLNHYLDFLLSFMIGLICYFSVVNACNYYKKVYTQEQFFDHIFTLISKAYYIPILVGFLELAAIYGLLPYNIKLTLNGIFGGWQSRLCMTTFEASWASMHMLILIAVSFYLYIKKKKRRHFVLLLISLFFFFIIASAQGMISLVMAAVLFLLLAQIKNNNVGKFLKNLFLVSILISVGGYAFYRILLLNPTSYYASRILYFTSLSNLLATDSSTFIRIGYLLLHILIFKDHFIFGIGGGSFCYVFAEYVYKYFPKSAYLGEVLAHLRIKDAGTAMSIYFSVLSEFGIIGVILFGSFLIKTLKRVKYLTAKMDKEILLFFAVCLALPIQFGSWAYVPWWFALAILSVLDKSWNGSIQGMLDNSDDRKIKIGES